MRHASMAAAAFAALWSVIVPAAAARASSLSTVYAFKGGADGGGPNGLIVVGGTFYGTTQSGGASAGTFGDGTIFSLTPAGQKTILYSFQGGSDGESPMASLLFRNGKFFGTTALGGAYAAGTLFVLDGGSLSITHSFGAAGDGAFPEAPLTAGASFLIGTTTSGGPQHQGTTYQANHSGSVRVVHNLHGTTEGVSPTGGLARIGKNFYGSATYGGTGLCSGGCGTIFRIGPDGRPSLVYDFQGGTDGANPNGGLIVVDGVLYGTTYSAGTTEEPGTVFSLTPTGVLKTLYIFKTGVGDGRHPSAGLLYDKGDFYGVTANGGIGDFGAVFRLSAHGTEKILHSFNGTTEGGGPTTTLVKLSGALYGTTSYGGDPACDNNHGCGTVFSLTP